MEFKFIEGKPPEDIHYQSKWMPVYKRLMSLSIGEWVGLEVPAQGVGNAISSIGAYLRKCGLNVAIKVDKTNVESGVAVLWFLKQEPKTFEEEVDDTKAVTDQTISIRGKKKKVVSVTDINYTGEDVQPLRVVKVVDYP